MWMLRLNVFGHSFFRGSSLVVKNLELQTLRQGFYSLLPCVKVKKNNKMRYEYIFIYYTSKTKMHINYNFGVFSTKVSLHFYSAVWKLVYLILVQSER